jgi:hypothetical protein
MQAAEVRRPSFSDGFCLNAALATLRGQSPKLISGWQQRLMARFVRTYFAPFLVWDEGRKFAVSDHYCIDLERHPMLADILRYLLDHGANGVAPENLQIQVWKESLKTSGWQQKIRNSVMRLRDLSTYTIAPLILHEEQVRIFSEAIKIKRSISSSQDTKTVALSLLNAEPLSAEQLADRLCISLSTSKRIIQKLVGEEKITPIKTGRSIRYESAIIVASNVN